MEFWGIEVKPGEILTVKPGNRKYIHLSQAACLQDPKNCRGTNIYIHTEEQQILIGNLETSKHDQLALDLVFGSDFKISHTSPNQSVFFSGYRTPDENPDFEEEGEKQPSGKQDTLPNEEEGEKQPSVKQDTLPNGEKGEKQPSGKQDALPNGGNVPSKSDAQTLKPKRKKRRKESNMECKDGDETENQRVARPKPKIQRQKTGTNEIPETDDAELQYVVALQAAGLSTSDRKANDKQGGKVTQEKDKGGEKAHVSNKKQTDKDTDATGLDDKKGDVPKNSKNKHSASMKDNVDGKSSPDDDNDVDQSQNSSKKQAKKRKVRNDAASLPPTGSDISKNKEVEDVSMPSKRGKLDENHTSDAQHTPKKKEKSSKTKKSKKETPSAPIVPVAGEEVENTVLSSEKPKAADNNNTQESEIHKEYKDDMKSDPAEKDKDTIPALDTSQSKTKEDQAGSAMVEKKTEKEGRKIVSAKDSEMKDDPLVGANDKEGNTMQTSADAGNNVVSCPECHKSFDSELGLKNHVADCSLCRADAPKPKSKKHKAARHTRVKECDFVVLHTYDNMSRDARHNKS